MEHQLTPLFQSLQSIIKDYETQSTSEINRYKSVLQEKDDVIQNLTELKDRQKAEMDDFLKVSFASRWKKSCEEAEKKIIHLEQKIYELTRTNEQLNHKLDKLSENDSQSTQTEDEPEIIIKTKKGAVYTLKNGKLFSKDGSLTGEVITT